MRLRRDRLAASQPTEDRVASLRTEDGGRNALRAGPVDLCEAGPRLAASQPTDDRGEGATPLTGDQRLRTLL